ncbi:hypothetical protein MPSEU_001005000 [Mayamaea pseudoterrestris]|nr:hypothetical protein MPSEU_001005000 [Mayamaea pseudoterrestris]
MVKKKKKQQADARGYQTTALQPPKRPPPAKPLVMNNNDVSPSANPPQQVRVTLSQQQRLEHLLELLLQFESESPESNNADTTSPFSPAATMTERKLAVLYDRLVMQVGLHFHLVCNAVQALAQQKQQLTMTTILNWICLHVPTDELPPILTEGMVRDELASTTTASTTLDVHWAPNASNEAIYGTKEKEEKLRRDNFFTNLLETSCSQTNEIAAMNNNDAEEEDRRREKARLLAQYAFVEADEDESDHEDDVVEHEVKMRDSFDYEETATLQNAHTSVSTPGDPAILDDGAVEENETVELQQQPLDNTERLQLQDLEQQLAQAQFDANDEASNYMRSKAEIKQIQSQVKQLQKQIKKMKEKLARNTHASAPVSRDVAADQEKQEYNDDDDDDDAVGLFDMFDVTAQVPAASVDSSLPAAANINLPPQNYIEIPDLAVPKSWTGALPKNVLKDWCRKEKVKPPRFAIQHVTVPLTPPLIVTEESILFASKANAEHYLATKALYQIHSDRPLYSMLPPFFRDLWKHWLHERQQATNEVTEIQSAERQARIGKLMQIVQEASQVGRALTSERHDETDNFRNDHASWESVDHLDEKPLLSKDTSALDNQRMKDAFCRLTTSSRYRTILGQRKELPMYSYREEFLATVRDNPVTVVYAQTGAGKTTQCPQFLLENALMDYRGMDTFILCTQPRRIAAVTVAERVSEEMGDANIGKRVGYQIRLESRRSDDTRLLFCTTGIVLRLLVENPLLQGISHIVVDEIHERQWHVDLLLVTLRNLVRGPRQDLKVVLMSATLDAKLFCSYFGRAPLVSVPGRTFPVTSYNLEHIIEATGHVIEEGSRNAIRSQGRDETASMFITTRGGEKKRETMSLASPLCQDISNNYPDFTMATRRSMDRVDESVINFDLIEDLLRLLLFETGQGQHNLLPHEGVDMLKGSILIFLPGKGEIRGLIDQLQGNRVFTASKLDIIPLHSTISSQDQRRAFQKSEKGRRKIIVATNIAETSVTIPDVVIVIDSGRVRELTSDKRSGTPRLLVSWCSKASVRQRSGRAGRVQPGLSLKLFSTKTEQSTMHDQSEPELRRIPLEEVCLTILSTGSSFSTTGISCRDFLDMTPQPPMEQAIVTALDSLEEIGALSRQNTKENLTPLGQLLVKLPLHPRLGKMLIYGALFQCIDPITTIAACLSLSKPLFLSDKAHEAKAAHAKFQHDNSDFITLHNVYCAFEEAQSIGDAFRFCKSNYLSLSSLQEAQDAKVLYLDLLSTISLLDRQCAGLNTKRRSVDHTLLRRCRHNKHGENEMVVHSVICSGMYPYVARLPNKSTGTANGSIQLEQKTNLLEIHGSSINSRVLAKQQAPSQWVCYHEKFATAHRVSVSTTCFVHPFSLLLFGSKLDVKHLEREVVVDDWISLRMPAKTGVLFQELRSSLRNVLKVIIHASSTGEPVAAEQLTQVESIIDGVVAILS